MRPATGPSGMAVAAASGAVVAGSAGAAAASAVVAAGAAAGAVAAGCPPQPMTNISRMSRGDDSYTLEFRNQR